MRLDVNSFCIIPCFKSLLIALGLGAKFCLRCLSTKKVGRGCIWMQLMSLKNAMKRWRDDEGEETSGE